MVNDAWHECLRPEDAAQLVDDLRANGESALTGCHHVMENTKVHRDENTRQPDENTKR
jgi:hypothetical protein